jgi:hypothetical protein
MPVKEVVIGQELRGVTPESGHQGMCKHLPFSKLLFLEFAFS